MINTVEAFDRRIGDTYTDTREGESGTLRIIDINNAGPCFQLRWSHMNDFDLCPYVSEDRFNEIAGGSAPLSGISEETVEDFDHFEPEALTPADTAAAHVHPRSDGSVVIVYFASAEALNKEAGSGCRALRNEVTGRFLFEGGPEHIVKSASQMIAQSLYPYRLSPDTRISAYTFPEKRSAFAHLRLKLLGGPAYIPSDDLTQSLEAELSNLAKSAPPSNTPVLTDWE